LDTDDPKLRYDFTPGDLVRFCTSAEAALQEFHEIDWCLGIWINRQIDAHSYDGFVDCYEEYDRVLYNGQIMECDAYWYIERAYY